MILMVVMIGTEDTVIDAVLEKYWNYTIIEWWVFEFRMQAERLKCCSSRGGRNTLPTYEFIRTPSKLSFDCLQKTAHYSTGYSVYPYPISNVLHKRRSSFSSILIAFFISPLRCSGSPFISTSKKPLTIAAVASSLVSPRAIRY